MNRVRTVEGTSSRASRFAGRSTISVVGSWREWGTERLGARGSLRSARYGFIRLSLRLITYQYGRRGFLDEGRDCSCGFGLSVACERITGATNAMIYGDGSAGRIAHHNDVCENPFNFLQ